MKRNRSRIVLGLAAATGTMAFLGWGMFACLRGLEVGTGPYGNAFGPVNGFGAAVAAVLALWSLRHQQMEMEADRAELAGQREEHEVQEALLSAQIRVGLVRLSRINHSHLLDIVLGRTNAGKTAEEQANSRSTFAKHYLTRLESWRETLLTAIAVVDRVEDSRARREGAAIAPPGHGDGADESVGGIAAWTVPAAMVGVTGLFVAWGLAAGSKPGQPVASALFGDAFGPLSGAATVAALLLGLWSLMLQREELRETREELRLQRGSMGGQNLFRIADIRVTAQAELNLWFNDLSAITIHQRQLLQEQSIKTNLDKLVDLVVADMNGHRARTDAAVASAFAVDAQVVAPKPS